MRRVLKITLNTVIYIAIIGGIIWGLPEFLTWKLGTNYPIAAITSGSMWPELKRGDLVFIEAVPREELHVGDIIVWQNSKGFTIHRVASLGRSTLVTKGDANFSNDQPVPYEDVIGRTVEWRDKSVRIPYLGLVSVFGGNIRATSENE